MEGGPESQKDSPQADKAAPAGFSPRISEAMAEFLVNTVAATAKMVQASVEAQKSAQLACFHAEESLAQARLCYTAARGLAERLLGFLSPPDYQGLFQLLPEPPTPYSDFCTVIRRAENALLHPVLKCKPGFLARCEPSLGSKFSCPPDIADNGLQGLQDLPCFTSSCVSETEEDGADEESQPLQIRGRNPSRHKQVETVLLEDQMGGTYMTHRRRSTCRSPSAGLDGLSPLVSEEDLSTIQPMTCCSSRQAGPGKFLSKATQRKERPYQENFSSNTDQAETSAKDAG